MRHKWRIIVFNLFRLFSLCYSFIRFLLEWSPLFNRSELSAWVVEGDRNDLEVSCSVDSHKKINHVGLCDKVEYIMTKNVPLVVSKNSTRHFLAKQKVSRRPK